MKHTLGPWYIEASHPKTPDTYRVRSDISKYKDTSTEESICITGNKANARLIAAAPEMLEALELLRDSTAVLNHLDRDSIDLINNVIAKARGES